MIPIIILIFLLANILACYFGYRALKNWLLAVLWFIVVWGLTAIPFLHIFGLMPEWGEKYWLTAGYSWLIGVFYLDFFIILIKVIFRLFDPQKRMAGRRILQCSLVLLLMAGFAGTGAYLAQASQIVTYKIKLPEQNPEVEKLNLVMVSDLHLGFLEDEKQLARWVEQINALQPQIICISGDILTSGLRELKEPEKFQQELARLSAPYGVYACLGNHDLMQNSSDKVIDWLQGAGIQVLRDEYVETMGLVVAGLDYQASWNRENTADLQFLDDLPNPDQPVILLEHSPARLAEQKAADLILAGHTHHGQIFPLNFLTGYLFENDYGYSSNGNTQMIVSCGLGTWGPPLRLGSQSEIVQVILEFS